VIGGRRRRINPDGSVETLGRSTPSRAKPKTKPESDADRANREAAASLRRRGIVDPDEGRRFGGRIGPAYAYGGVVVGPVMGVSPGRADDKRVDVPGGSFVIPADCVAALGDGNTLAGHKKLERVFGPATSPRSIGGAVPIMISDGEYVLTPQQVTEFGRGNHAQGCLALDKFVTDTRAQHIKHLQKLPPPAKS
jgi:hypothetical protein